MANCRHCKVKTANRPRTLCWTCWHAPGVKESYPTNPTYRFGNGTDATKDSRTRVSALPTKAMPGVPGMVAEMERRAAAGQPIFSPGDAHDEEDRCHR